MRQIRTLHALGHNNVAILDGGFAVWDQAEKPVSKKAAIPSPGDFTGSLVAVKLATFDEVKGKLGSCNVVFVDNRGPVEHFGHQKKSHVARYGHLPGSRLWPADYLTNAGVELSPSFLKKVEELRQMSIGVGIPQNKNVDIITYNNHGKAAAMGYFVLHDILGYKNVKVFDGSILEAAADKEI